MITEASFLFIKQISSTIRRPKNQRAVIVSLGLRGIGSTSRVPNTPGVRRLLNRFTHLIKILPGEDY